MIILSIFQTVEFYIVAAFMAAAVVAAASMPSRRSSARMYTYGGTLRTDAAMSEAGIIAQVNDSGELVIHRFGLDNLTTSGAYSIAVTIIGFDVTIEERITCDRFENTPATAAYVSLDCLGPERYHFLYKSEATGRSASFSLNIRPGNRIDRLLI